MSAEYECPACHGRLEERRGELALYLVCIRCERVAGVGFEKTDVTEQIPGQTTIEEFLRDD